MKKNLFFTLATAALLASCSSENDELFNTTPEGQSDELTEIKLSATSLSVDADSSQKKMATRAAFEGNISGTNQLVALVPLSTNENDFSTPYEGSSHGTITFTNGSATGFTTPQYYPAKDDTPIYMVGLYPAEEWTEIATTAKHSIDGKTDIMHANQQQTTKNAGKGGTYPTLTFNHLLTKLDIVIKGENESAVSAWGKITSLKLKKARTSTGMAVPYNQLKVTLKDGAVSYEELTTGDIACWQTSDDKEISTSNMVTVTTEQSTAQAYVLAPAVTASATGDDAEYELEVTTEKITTPVTVKVDLKTTAGTEDFTGDTKGKAFTVTLNFKATEIKVNATVTDWVPGGIASEDIQ